MPKIYLSPPYHRWNPCSYSSTCNETDHGNQYCDEMEPYLRACGIEYKRGPRRVPMSGEDGTALMKKAVAESNAWGPDLHYVTHTNAANGTVKGSRPMIYPGSSKGRAIADKIIAYRKKIYPYPIQLNERSDLYELKSTSAPTVYEELIFHDNKEDANWLHANMRKLAEYTVRALCDYFGIKFVDPYSSKGDVDGDGKVTTADALKVLQGAVGKVELDEQQKEKADLDGDGKITTADALGTLQNSVGKE